MSTRNKHMMPWLAALLCLTLTPGAKATDEADAPKAPSLQASGAQPKLAEQDVWRRWRLAHEARNTRTEPKLTSVSVRAIQPGELAEQDVWRRWQLAHDGRETSAEIRSSEGAPTRCNKASGILGMDVRNQSGEPLGHIKDLVFDWKTEQVSYAVISTAPKDLLGLGGKLLAVPLTALAVSSDQKHLILNADKSKVATAPGFDSHNWPSVSNPSWGADPFWQHDADNPAVTYQPAK